MDIRDWSFRGLDCQGWDFSGRDIRGCDFRNAKLNTANFTRVISGRTTKQQIRDVIIVVAFILLFVVAVAVPVTVIVTDVGAVLNASAFLFTFAFILAAIFVFILLFAVKFVVVLIVAFVFVFLFTVVAMGVVFAKSAIDSFAKGQILLGIIFILLAIGACTFSFYSARGAVNEFKSATGTDFSGTCLQSVDFTSATLNNCKFDAAETSYVNWRNVNGKRSTIDFGSKRIQLLTSRKGANGIYQSLDLSKSNLFAIDLMKANLSGTDLTSSNLQNTDLRFANLSNAKAGGTDFSHAKLTGACIQNWMINPGTKFEGIECEHIYLTPDQSPENRRPLSGNYEPGDFELLVDKFTNTLDFILRRGEDPVAFKQSLFWLQQDYPDVSIESIKNLDTDRALVQVSVSKTTSKVAAYESFQNSYAQLQSANEKIRYLEGVEEGRQRSHIENQGNLSMIQQLVQPSTTNVKVIAGTNPTGDSMTDKSTQYQTGDNANIAIGGSAINSGTGAAAAGDISGNLTITLAALAATEDPKEKELATLLEQVKKTIEAPDCELDDRYKKRALEYLDSLGKLAKEQPENRLKKAKENLDDLADIADKGLKVATFTEKYLPTFVSAIDALKIWFGIL